LVKKKKEEKNPSPNDEISWNRNYRVYEETEQRSVFLFPFPPPFAVYAIPRKQPLLEQTLASG